MLKIYSNYLLRDDLFEAAQEARMLGAGGHIQEIKPMGKTRTRTRGYEVQLTNPSSNRHRNSGTHGAATWESSAATWDDHGHWFAQIFRRDPKAKCGPYDGVQDFHQATNQKYALPNTETEED